MTTATQRRADLMTALAHIRRRLKEMERLPAGTISERMERGDACCQVRRELGRLELQLNGIVAGSSRGLMNRNDAEDDPSELIGIPLFECQLAVDVTLLAMRSLARRSATKAFEPKLEELVQLLTDCRERLDLLTDRLDAMFGFRDGKPN